VSFSMMRKLFILSTAFVGLCVFAKTPQTYVSLADGHKIYYDQKHWDYALSEKTFQKTMPLIEHRAIPGLRGVFENEVRFISKRSPASAPALLKNECDKARKFYGEDNYSVTLESNHCVVQTVEGHQLPKSMYQVIEAKISRSRADMLFFYTWTFHFPEKTRVESLGEISALMNLEGNRS